jgi:hypothetical protein
VAAGARSASQFCVIVSSVPPCVSTRTNGSLSPEQWNGSKLGYTRRELSEALGVSIRSIARAEVRGQIRSMKTWRTKLYPANEVARFLREGL